MPTVMSALPHAPGLVLFAEDFDIPAKARLVPDAEIIEPSFTRTELEAARQQGWKAGQDAAATAAEQAHDASIRQMIAEIGVRLSDARVQASATAQQAADELARLLLDSVAAVVPSLAARYGETELRSLVHMLAPALAQEAKVCVRVNPACATAVIQEIERVDADLAARLQVVACDTMPPGDIRIVWQGGQAVRDVAALWAQVADVLMPAELLSDAMTKEAKHGE